MSDFDSPWKEILDAYFQLFLAYFFPQAHDEIDWRHGYEALDKELQQVVPTAEQGRRFVDKLVKVWLKDGEERWILVHVEVQTAREADFPKRMYVYNYRLFDRYNREVVSLAILGDDDPAWRPDHFGYSRWGFSTTIRFPTIKLLDYSADEQVLESSSNPFALIVLAHLKTLETRRKFAERQMWKLRLVKGLYGRGFTAADVRQLFRFVDWLMDLPPALENHFEAEVLRFEEEKQMPYVTSVERSGHERGLREGLVAGIELALELKFGTAGLQLMPEVRAVEDVERLRTLHQAIKTSSDLDSLRQAWA